MVVVALIKLIKSKKKEFTFRNIQIITPYRAQKIKIINELKKTFGDNAMPGEVDTVDGFQGRQKDCIIVTCVRANSIQGCIGFLASRQRLNVTITRAKFSLFILGSLRTLMENKDWNHLIQDAQRRGALVKTKQPNYERDVNTILKFNPMKPRTTSFPPAKQVEVHRSNMPQTPPTEVPCRGNINLQVPEGSPPKRTIAHPALSRLHNISRSLSIPPVSERKVPSNTVPPAIPSASRGKLQDPRLARRHEESRSNSTATPSLHQSSGTSSSHGHSYRRSVSSPAAGVKRPTRPSGRDPPFSQPRNEGRDRDYRSNTDQEPKKRKVS